MKNTPTVWIIESIWPHNAEIRKATKLLIILNWHWTAGTLNCCKPEIVPICVNTEWI